MPPPALFRLTTRAGLALVLLSLAACAGFHDRMADGRRQLSQGNYVAAENAFAEAAEKAEDGEGLYHSLKALSEVYRQQGAAEKADETLRQAVKVMGHCLEDKMAGQRPCPRRDEAL